jgi:L-fuculose-phosphate aldolase
MTGFTGGPHSGTHPVRQQVVELCHDLARRGYFAATGGNLALRIGTSLIAVTPSATDYYGMQPEDVAVVRLNDLRQIEGNRPPSVETGLHVRLLEARPDCNCSIHTHQPAASACTLLGEPLEVSDPKHQHMLGARVPMVGYAPSGTRWLAASLAKAVRRDVNAYLMRNHGAVCCGPDAGSTVARIVALEELASEYLRGQIRARAAADPSLRPTLQRLLDHFV